jgi:hypothetical protein
MIGRGVERMEFWKFWNWELRSGLVFPVVPVIGVRRRKRVSLVAILLLFILS